MKETRLFNDNLESLRKIFVSIENFMGFKENINVRLQPVEKIVYGGVGFVLLAVLSSIIYGVIRSGAMK